jgi:hypothetical protein
VKKSWKITHRSTGRAEVVWGGIDWLYAAITYWRQQRGHPSRKFQIDPGPPKPPPGWRWTDRNRWE